jgi:hypothetical protein
LGLVFTFTVPIGITDDKPHFNQSMVEINNTRTRSRADTDGDGLSDENEVLFQTDLSDPDSDDDGVLDGQEGLNVSKNQNDIVNDPDQDGRNNARDADSDGDGVLDGTEMGVTDEDLNLSATDQTKGRFFPDQDPSTTTDMTKWDTDGDTWSDGEEDKNVDGKYQPDNSEMDPNFKDYDDDGLHDDTQDDDDDNDGMPDNFEEAYSLALDPLDPSDRDKDYDKDGFSNYREYLGDDNQSGNSDWSDPTKSLSVPVVDSDNDNVPDESDAFPFDPSASTDSDFDGCPDEWNPGKSKLDSTSVPKLNFDIYPSNPGACLDFDNDNLPDSLDTNMNTNPLLVEDEDDDNDGMPDSWERLYGFNPFYTNDSMEDADSDGFSNLNEYISNTEPRDPNSYPDLSKQPGRNTASDDWIGFLGFVILVVFGMMLVAIFIGFYVIKKRSQDEEFWMSTFGDAREPGVELDEESRQQFQDWRRRVEAEGIRSRPPGQKYKLEIIGGPDDEDSDALPYPGRPSMGTRRRQDPRFKGRQCLWCNKGITQKFIKHCPEQRPGGRRCPDGPFCSRRCLNEHLKIVPHHQEVNF